MAILSAERIELGASATDKSDAIRQVGELLVANGCVKAAYVDGMLTREETMSTFLGNGVAIPHGMHENIDDILQSGIAVLQLPEGVVWEDDEVARLIIGIAATSDEHMGILMNLAEVVEDEDSAELLATTTDVDIVLERLNRQAEPEEEELDF